MASDILLGIVVLVATLLLCHRQCPSEVLLFVAFQQRTRMTCLFNNNCLGQI